MTAATVARAAGELVDTALVRQAQTGDEQATAELLRRTRPLIQRTAGRLCRDADALEDVVQNCLVIVFTELGNLRAPEAFIGWVQGIVRNVCCKEAHRSQAARAAASRLAERSMTEAAHTSASDPEDVVVQHEAAVHLQRALQMLPPRYRRVTALRGMYGFSYDEIGQRLDIPSALARLWFFRSRRRLRELCSADEVLAQRATVAVAVAA